MLMTLGLKKMTIGMTRIEEGKRNKSSTLCNRLSFPLTVIKGYVSLIPADANKTASFLFALLVLWLDKDINSNLCIGGLRGMERSFNPFVYGNERNVCDVMLTLPNSRGLKKVTMQAMLTFAAMNLKKLATWLWESGQPSDRKTWFRSIFIFFNNKLPMRCMSLGSLSSI